MPRLDLIDHDPYHSHQCEGGPLISRELWRWPCLDMTKAQYGAEIEGEELALWLCPGCKRMLEERDGKAED